MSMQFVQAKVSDYLAIEEIYHQAFPRYLHFVGRDLSSDPRGELGEYRREENLWLARDDAGIAGFLLLSSHCDRLELETICVLPARQKTGVGPFLLDSIEQLARDRGVKSLCLHTARKMAGLVRLYQQQGYRIVGEGPPQHGLDEHQRVFMEKRIIASQ